MTYMCKDGLLPRSIMTSECYANKSWIPNPAQLICIHHREGWRLSLLLMLYRDIKALHAFADKCTFPSPPRNGAITNFSSTCTEAGTMVTFQCNNGFTPVEEIISTCLEDGTWEVNPLTFTCTALKISGDYINNNFNSLYTCMSLIPVLST